VNDGHNGLSNPVQLEPPKPLFRNTQQHHVFIVFRMNPTWKMKLVLTAGRSGSICAPWSFTSIPDILALSCSSVVNFLQTNDRKEEKKCHVYWSGFGCGVTVSDRWVFSFFLHSRASVRALLQRVICARVTQPRPAARELTETTGTRRVAYYYIMD